MKNRVDLWNTSIERRSADCASIVSSSAKSNTIDFNIESKLDFAKKF